MGSAVSSLLRLVAGPVFGAGLASIARAATAPIVVGPASVTLWGADVPIWSALFGLIGVLLARRVAPASVAGRKLGRAGNAALTGLLGLGVMALIVSGEKRPIVALGWAIGLGYSGLGAIELVARAMMHAGKVIMDTFVEVASRSAAAWAERKGTDK